MSKMNTLKLSACEYAFQLNKLSNFMTPLCNYEYPKNKIVLEMALNDFNSVLYTTKSLIAQTPALREMWYTKLDEFESAQSISTGFIFGINAYRDFLENLTESPYYQA